MQTCEVHYLGIMPYDEAWALQRELAVARAQNAIPDTLLLLQHPPTYTLGSSGKSEHLLMSSHERAQRGVKIYHVDRGGDITYHGPGQLVGYPILKLPTYPGSLHGDVLKYVRQLEETLIIALQPFGIQGERCEGLTGVWVPVDDHLEKIAAIGVKVTSRAITQHGFALNIAPDLSFFKGIVPCGIPDKPVTSMKQLLGTAPYMDAVIDQIVRVFSEVMEFDTQYAQAALEPD